MRNRTGRPSRPVLSIKALGGAAAALALAAAPLPSSAARAAEPAAPAVEWRGDSVAEFYQRRGERPLWFATGRPGPQVQQLIALLESSEIDGLDRSRYRVRNLLRAVRSAQRGDARAVQRADRMLSEALVAFVRDLRRPADIGMKYVDAELRPAPPSPTFILERLQSAPDPAQYIATMGWMHPMYVELRNEMLRGGYSSSERQIIQLNLERARELPSNVQKHVVVNTAAQRLFMYEDGRVVDSMRVVVGKPKYPTPMLAAFIRYAALNPYWNVPADLAAERVAPNVVKEGLSYLRSRGYQVLSDWTENAVVMDPNTVNWQAVAEGRQFVRLRQLPGPSNAMGRMKFMFPNDEGVYLHDTPEKELLSEASRLFSGGCVRLQDAARLGKWLFGKPLNPSGAGAEQKVPLSNPVPVYLTYLTAVPSGSRLAFFDDIYGRDATRLAQIRGGKAVASR